MGPGKTMFLHTLEVVHFHDCRREGRALMEGHPELDASNASNQPGCRRARSKSAAVAEVNSGWVHVVQSEEHAVVPRLHPDLLWRPNWSPFTRHVLHLSPQTQKTFSKYYHSKFAAFQSAPGCHADDGPRTRRHRTSYTETNGTDLNNKTGTTGEEMILFCWVSGGFPINIPRQDAQGIPQTS